VYYNGELGDNVTPARRFQGANIVTFPTFDFYAPYILDVSILDGPFFFQSPDELAKLEASDWWAEQVQKMEDINLWYGGAMYLGARSLLHNVPGAKLPEDFKGQVMRSASTTMRHAMCEAITGNVATIAWSEIYSALSTGVAEMCEAPLGSIVSTKIYEVCRYITLDEHIYAFQAPWIAKSWVDALPADVREGFERAVKETCAESVDYINQSEAEYRALLESEGVTFIEVDDKDAWVEATKSHTTRFSGKSPICIRSVRRSWAAEVNKRGKASVDHAAGTKTIGTYSAARLNERRPSPPFRTVTGIAFQWLWSMYYERS
jgi:TRAP-type C4-dicarboxylate transport system substrate-binding protein